MGLIGAVLGDIAGSNYEYHIPKDIDRLKCDLFTDKDFFTDDTVLAIATKYAIDKDISFEDAYQEIGRLYPESGYGGKFDTWLNSSNPKPYNSFGNGSAMRVSYIGDYADDVSQVIELATKSAECTHNHPEGIKGAVVTAMCVYLARTGRTKSDIYKYALNQYPAKDYTYGVDLPLHSYKDNYKYDVTCQGTVPTAIRCFLESDSYISFIRNCYSLKQPDLDTICAIGGGIAESFYGTTGLDNELLLNKYLDKRLLRMIKYEF